MKNKDMVAKVTLLTFVGLIVLTLFYLSGVLDLGSITGFAIFESGDQSDFDEGIYSNTEWNGSAIVLVSENFSGTYSSKVFNASSEASWKNISWESEIRESLDFYLYSAIHSGTNMTEVFVLDENYYLADMKDSSKNFYLNFSEDLIDGTILKFYAKEDKGVTIGIYAQSDSNGENPLGIFTVDSATGDWYNITLNVITPTNAIWIGEGNGSGIDPKDEFDYIYAEIPGTNLNLSVRTCDNDLCSDEDWNDIIYSSPQNLSLGDNQYFQYKFDFETADFSVSPSLQSVSLNYDLVNTAPTITLISPQQDATYGSNESLALNFIASDTDDNLDSCWYNIDEGGDVLLPSCANTSFDVPGNGNYNLIVYANDSQGEEASDSVNFSVEVGAPTIILNSPINIYLDDGENIYFDYTPTDINLDSCELWGDFNGNFMLNQIDDSPISGISNNFSLNLDDGDYLWNIRCNDSVGNSAFNGNKTFYVDSVNPSMSISEPVGLKTSRTGIPLSFSVSDNHLDSCWYNVYRGGSLEIVNTSVNCSSSAIFDVTVDADFVLNFYANDFSGNLNVKNSNFNVDTSTTPASPPSSSSSSGGGGGSFPSSIGMNLELTPIEAIMYPGEEKSLELIVKNNGIKSVNKCKLKTSDKHAPWVSSIDIKNIAAGEIVEFGFTLTLPANADQPKIFLECLEGNESVPLKIVLVKPSLNIEFSEIVLKDSSEILIKYSVESESDLVSNLIFSVYSNDEKIAEQIQGVELVKDKRIRGEVVIKIDDVPSGLLKISVTNQGGEKPLVESSIVYNSDMVSGFVVGDFVKSEVSYVVIIILVFLIFAIIIIRRIIKKPRKKK
ncbi:hypothetical protein KAI32_03325 [Candidatus Pacearchaeota archaeon]|nr:hypothetical protein [Candidatus Pacearchaeota archaeon]